MPKGEPIAVISYKGKPDSKTRNTAALRLANARKYLTGAYYKNSDSYRTNEQITGAMAHTKRNEGTLEFYGGGKLLLVIHFGKNANLLISCALGKSQP